MDFFQHQDQARKQTRYLLLLFSLAIISLIVITSLFIAVILYFSDSYTGYVSSQMINDGTPLLWQLLSTKLVASVAAVVLIVVAMGSLFKWVQLSAGGSRVALSLGGRRVLPNTAEPDERQLLNVVEEMAIASGTPVPPVYLLDQAGINAFAAGNSVQDAVIGVTRGCMTSLSRDELQGVIAHEFSHILHGDMGINMRLIGVLHGILAIGLIGSMLMRSGVYSSYGYRRRNNDRDSGGILLVGLGLVVIGYCGTFFGNLIKAAVSRQREFLADAAAVQFTRNADGISGALQKIGGFSQGAQIQHSQVEQFSHMYFGNALSNSFGGLLSTHPPLETRIKRITPNWNGRFPVIATPKTSSFNHSHISSANIASASVASANAASTATAMSPSNPQQPHHAHDASQSNSDIISHVGTPTAEHVAYATALLQSLETSVKQAAHDPFSARAVVYCLLIQEGEHCAKQWQQLESRAHPVTLKFTKELYPTIHRLTRQQRLPLIELCVPALKELSSSQHDVFKQNVIALIKADHHVDIFEWALYRLLVNALEPSKRLMEKTVALKYLAVPCQQLLSTLATAGHETEAPAVQAYKQAMQQLGFSNLPLLGSGAISLPMLDSAIKQLQHIKPLQKPQLLKVLLQCVQHDEKIQAEEYELFRAIADCLNCPMPPLLNH